MHSGTGCSSHPPTTSCASHRCVLQLDALSNTPHDRTQVSTCWLRPRVIHVHTRLDLLLFVLSLHSVRLVDGPAASFAPPPSRPSSGGLAGGLLAADASSMSWPLTDEDARSSR